ncbi:MAG: DUF1800 domain-containing protein, partial [Bacteroidota bacterium]
LRPPAGGFPAPVPPSPQYTTEPIEVRPGVFAPAGIPIRVGRGPERPATGARVSSASSGRALQTSTGLERYVPSASAPWTKERTLHMLHRMGYGATQTVFEAAYAEGPAAVDAIIDRAIAQPLPAKPSWYDESFPPWESAEYRTFVDRQNDRLAEYQWEVYRAMLSDVGSDLLDRTAVAFRERLALFWSNHFVTEQEVYFFSPFLARYWQLMRTHALGDFRQFVYDVGIDPAMLIYLNGRENRSGNPNENYARELLELFTMGITDSSGAANYTQQDIVELSRALTGWEVDFQGTLDGIFYDFWHDRGSKTILGRTGAWGYDDIVPILFEERAEQIADFISRKIYREFVYDVPSEPVVAQMAALFLQSGFQIEPVVRALLNSAHFFDEAVIRSRIKSPVERSMGLWTTLQAPVVPDIQGWMQYQLFLAEQIVFQPWNVAGWPGGRTWVDTSTLSIRWFGDSTTLWIVVDFMTQFAVEFDSPYDPRAFVREASTLLLGIEPTEEAVESYTNVLLGTIPDYEWNPYADGATVRIRAFVEHITRLPEFQLT